MIDDRLVLCTYIHTKMRYGSRDDKLGEWESQLLFLSDPIVQRKEQKEYKEMRERFFSDAFFIPQLF
jgi:hypothetical protein